MARNSRVAGGTEAASFRLQRVVDLALASPRWRRRGAFGVSLCFEFRFFGG